MKSQSHYSTCVERPHVPQHQNSRTILLRDNSLTSDVDEGEDDVVFLDSNSNPSTMLSIRSGSDQCESFSTRSHPSASFTRRSSLPDRRLLSNRRLSCQDRPLPPPPTHYDNVDHMGQVQTRSTRSASAPNENHQFASSPRGIIHLPIAATAEPGCETSVARICYFCFVIFVCGLSISASAVSLYAYNAMVLDHDTNYCLPCSELTRPPRQTAVSGYQLTTKVANGQELCCVNSSDGLTLLVATIQRYEQMNSVVSQNITSAHVGLYADRKHLNAIQQASYYTLHISAEPTLQHCQNVLPRMDRLSILISGLYFVYSSIHYDLGEYKKTCMDLSNKSWVHHVYLKRTTVPKFRPMALLRSEHTCCENCTEDSNSGFTGGVFRLHTGDEIFVDVSAPPLVVDSKQTSYLGLFLMDEQ